ncbi:MAG TPA: pantoate--beta-alanine ligase [Candidatus Nanoarchaeia archaeon]|nr:pantoate--beta-alanine ligase [Candidatus Nanoarchaeia archaeon]
MKVMENIREMQAFADSARAKGKTIGFVPTMGCLHEGHLSLIRRARKETDIVVVSIYVNPLQFAPHEDFAQYPRNFKTDAAMCKKEKVDLIFYPDDNEMYTSPLTSIEVDWLSKPMCGASRPHFFQGVATVVSKLFNIVKPHKAYFGQKDYQQSLVIRKMVKDLNFPIEIVTCPIFREKDGLAMSSRNKYLNEDQRKQAAVLCRSLELAQALIQNGERRAAGVRHAIKKELQQTSAKIDYIEIRDARTLHELDALKGQIVIAVAAYFGTTRLIDNIILDVKP